MPIDSNAPAPKTAAIYCRISSDSLHEGLGVARQLEDCRKYAADNAFEVVAELVDNDISAYSGKPRPGYQELLESMRAGQIQAVITWHTDRLHRSPVELEEYIDISEKAGVTTQTVKAGKIDLSTPSGRAVARTLGAWARYESEHKSERVQRKHLELAETGKWIGKRVYGFTAEAEIVPKEAAIIREMAERLLTGGEGFNSIARDLNARGIGTIKSSTWRASTVATILRSARIAGHREHHGVITARNAWPAIISEETSMLLRERLAPGRPGAKRGGARTKLLSGILRCGTCGKPMVGGFAGRTKTPNYRCPATVGAKNCGGITIVAGPTEALIAEMLFEAADQAVEPQAQDAAMVAEWAVKRKELDARKRGLADMAGKGLLDLEEFAIASQAVKAEIAALPEPDMRPKRPRKTGQELREAWGEMPISDRRLLVEGAFVAITVKKRIITTGAKVFDPRRFEFIWR